MSDDISVFLVLKGMNFAVYVAILEGLSAVGSYEVIRSICTSRKSKFSDVSLSNTFDIDLSKSILITGFDIQIECICRLVTSPLYDQNLVLFTSEHIITSGEPLAFFIKLRPNASRHIKLYKNLTFLKFLSLISW